MRWQPSTDIPNCILNPGLVTWCWSSEAPVLNACGCGWAGAHSAAGLASERTGETWTDSPPRFGLCGPHRNPNWKAEKCLEAACCGDVSSYERHASWEFVPVRFSLRFLAGRAAQLLFDRAFSVFRTGREP
ncbi:hypothetical protein AOLI_G00293080 [Acnodon oligacanthus]